MADFKLSEVAKKAGITEEEALQKLADAGEGISGTDIALSAEQMRILGINPQKLIDRRKERLQQALARRNKGIIGKEIVMNDRNREEPVQPQNRKMSKEELLKRKSELNKDIQKVDEVRMTAQRIKSETTDQTDSMENAVNDDAFSVEPENVKSYEPSMPTQKSEDVKPAPVAQDAESPSEQYMEKSVEQHVERPVERPIEKPVEKSAVAEEPAKTTEAEKPLKTTPRPLGPAGYVPPAQREQRGSGQRSDYRRTETRTDDSRKDTTRREGTYQRPSGPAADRNKPAGPRAGFQRPAGPAADRNRSGGLRDKGGYESSRPSSGGVSRGRPGAPASRPETSARPDEERRRERKPKDAEPAVIKEDAKKVKPKTETLKTKDWNKTINEGMSELNIENEIVNDVVVEEAAAPSSTTAPKSSGKNDRRQKRRQERETPAPTPKPTHITIGENIVVAELAGLMGVKATELVKKLFSIGIMATVNQAIDAESATLLAIEYGIEVTTKVVSEDDLMPVYEDKPEDLERRPPVVTVMGHVDHGKTSLLDAIRSTAVVEKEAGGITQHIGAYEVDLNGRKITFLDTPGHEAFTSLRARGAQVTDIVILVVAANDGVMPQTKEAIDHSKAAGVRLVVAINKIDRPDANPDKVKQQLAEYGIIPDEWGGENQFQEISAKKGIGIEDLLERVLLEADVLELKGNPNRPAEAIVIESQLDKQRGPVATLLIKNGTLRRGDTFVVGSQVGRVRSMYNYRHNTVKEATISMPVEVMGFSTVPESGDNFIVVEDEKVARNIAELRESNSRTARLAPQSAVSLTDFFSKVQEGQVQELNIIIKADVQGSLEALRSSLLKLSNAEVKVHVVHDATGGITESDVVLAKASKAIIIGFNVRPDNNARALAEKDNISIELYSIIYKAIEDVKLALEGMLKPETIERVIGKVEVRQVFSVPKLGKIAGSYVLEGKVVRNSLVRVIRDNVVVYDGKLGSLKRFTDDVKEVAAGYECGLSIEKYQDIKEKDILEVYELIQEKRTLEDVAEGR